MSETKLSAVAATPQNRPKQEIWNIFFILLFLESLFMGTMTSAFNSANALHVAYLNGTATQRALMISALPCAALLTRLCIGRVVETHSRRTLIAVGLSIMALMTAGFLLSSDLNVLIAFRFGQGIGMSIAQTTSSVACTDIVSRPRLGEGLGYYALTNFFNQAIMPSVTVHFTDRNDFNGLYTLSLVALLVGIVCILLCRYEKKYPHLVAPPTTRASLLDDPGSGYDPDKPITRLWMIFEKRAVPCTLIAMFSTLGGSVITNYLLLYAKAISVARAGLFFTLQAFSMFVTRLLTAKLVDRHGSFKVYVPGVALAAGAFVCLSLCERVPALYYVAGPLYGMATGLITPALNAAAVRSCPEARRSIASSTYMLSSDVAMGVGGFICSFLISLWGYGAMFGFSFVCYALSMTLAIRFFCFKMRGTRI